MEKSLYIGGGFSESQLLFVLPFAHGYSKKMGITKWIFEIENPYSIKSHPITSSLLQQYKVDIFKAERGFWRYLNLLKNVLLGVIPAIFLSFKVSRFGLLNKSSWLETQLIHAVWDTAQNTVPDGTLNLSFFRRFMGSLKVYVTILRTKKLLKNWKICSSILGHTVYTDRAQLAFLVEEGVDVITHGAFNFYRFFKNKDSSFKILSSYEWERLFTLSSIEEIDLFWGNRRVGISNYSEAQVAANLGSLKNPLTSPNVILLHVFRDSPFNYIDQTRIFSDYVDWVISTFDILKNSPEEWLVKFHPSATRWGEDQWKWVTKIMNKVFGNDWPLNIKFTRDDHSNIDIFEGAKRIVTYHGTAHLEAACWGIKPIVISNVTLSSFDPEMVLKPVKLDGYADLLLLSSEHSCFKLSNEQQLNARYLLYFRDEVLSFKRDIGGSYIYRSDSDEQRNEDFKNVSTNMAFVWKDLESLGVGMASGLNRSVSMKKLKQFQLVMESKY